MADVPIAPTPHPEEQYQSLYRRYRPQRFEDVRGQEHVTRPLRNAVRDDRVAHAYLFSGPRGTGKTSTARILAMALNCAHPVDGEPDGTCASCLDIRRGSSLDVQELDAASNRKLDEMRDLLSRVALGTHGRRKVYIVDEVHQLTNDAASALLKTLEEPPGHVVWVLATTDPQKVLPTIRSRTQHYEFHLLGADVLVGLLRDVNDRAALGLPPEAIDLVVRRGHGSARDALSVLDQVAAAGGVEDESEMTSEIVDAVADQDAGRVLVAVAEAMSTGRDPRRLAAELLDHLRNGFLATQARSLVHLPDDAVAEVERQAARLGLAGVVKAMEVVGLAAVDMRDAVDPRVTLEVALVRLASPRLDAGGDALLQRLHHLEAQVAALAASSTAPTATLPPGAAPAAAPPPERVNLMPAAPPPGRETVTPAPSAPPPPRASAGVGPDGSRPALGALRRSNQVRPTSDPLPPEAPSPSDAASLPTRAELTKAWGDEVLSSLRPAVKAYVSAGRFVDADASAAVYALPDRGLLARAEPLRGEVEAALTARFGRRVPLRLVLDASPGVQAVAAPQDGGRQVVTEDADDDLRSYDLDDLADAEVAVVSPEQRLLEAFPGAEEVTPP